jgi:hypothetical protein
MRSTTTRRAAVIAVVGLLVGGSVGVGALVAVAQPNDIAFTTASGDVAGPGWPGVSGTVDWTDGGSGGSVTLTVVNSAGTNTYCTGSSYPDTDETWDCLPTLQYGSNTITATATETDDPGNPLSTAEPIVITYGGTQPATIVSPPDTATNSTATTFSGTGSQMGTVDLRAYPVGNPGAIVDICADTPVNASGAWSCLASFPERRIWTVQAQSVTLTGLDYGPPVTQTFTFNNQRPDTAVVSTPGVLRLDATPGSTGATVGTVWRYYADSDSGGPTVQTCAAAPTQACTVPGPVLPGLYLASSNAYSNDTGSSDRGDFVRIPAAPVITGFDDDAPGQLSVAGSFDTTFSEPFGQVDGNGTPVVDIIDADTSVPLCDEIELDSSGDWNCTIAAPTGTHDYVAVARTSTPIGTSNAQDVFSAGTSARSNLITATVDPAGTLQITSPSPSGGSSEWLSGPTSFTIAGTSTISADVDVFLDGEPLGTSCSNRPVVGGDWSCTTAIDPGTSEIRASQVGSPDAVLTWTVTIPAPVVGGVNPLVIPSGGTAAFSGTVSYTQGEVRVEVEVSDGSYESCSDEAPYGPESDWTCSVVMSAYPDGNYNARISIVDGSEQSPYVYRTLTIGEAPDLVCSFGPAAGTFSSPHPMAVYTVFPAGPSSSGWYFDLADQALCNGAPGNTFADGSQFEGSLVTGCAADCDVSGLAPGIYEVYVESGDGYSYLFTIPETPAFTTTASSGSDVITTGTGTALDRIQVQRPDGGVLCSTTVDGSGAWACAFPKSSADTARVIAIDPSSPGMSVYTAARSIPVLVAVQPPVTPTPTPTPTLTLTPTPGPTPTPTPPPAEIPVAAISWLLQFGGDLSKLKPGDTFTVSIDGMPAGWTIEMWMHSTPRLLESTTATGAPMTLELTVPMDIEAGAHEVEMVATTPNGTSYFERTDAVVLASATTDDETPEETPADDDDTAGGGSHGAMGAERADPAAPSALSNAVAPLSAIIANPASIAVAGGLALALLILVALPTELLNSSLSSNTSRLGRAYGAVDGALTRAQDWFIKVTRSRAVAAVVLTTLVAIIYGFVDPGFGFDIVSLRLVLSLAIAFFLLSFVASWISGLIIRRAWGAMGVVAMQPSIILFAIVGVIVARVLDFSPGFLVGVAIGLELLQASKTVTAKAVFVQLGVVTGLALAAWVVYSFFTPGNDFFGMLLEDTMVATTAEGLTGGLIAVFPLKFLDGRELWDVSKRLWVAAFLIVSVAFALLVLPTAIEGTDVGDYGVWLLVFAVFGLVSLAVWLVFVRADAKAARAGADKVDA